VAVHANPFGVLVKARDSARQCQRGGVADVDARLAEGAVYTGNYSIKDAVRRDGRRGLSDRSLCRCNDSERWRRNTHAFELFKRVERIGGARGRGRVGIVSVVGVGSELPLVSSKVVGEPESSVIGGLFGSELKTNSCTVPVTCTRLPDTAAAGTLAPVKTKTPSDVFGSASTVASGS